MKRIAMLFPLSLLLAATSLHAATDVFQIDPQHSYPNFAVSHLGYSIAHGRFDKTEGRIELDRAARQGRIEVSIDAASVSTGLPQRDNMLRSDRFFDATRFPTISFISDQLRFDGDKLASAEGTLTLHGVSKPVTFAVQQLRCAEHPMLKREVCGAELNAHIKRSDFGLNGFSQAVGDDVDITVQVEAVKMKRPIPTASKRRPSAPFVLHARYNPSWIPGEHACNG